MVITIPAQQRQTHGPRPINLNNDVPEVIKLLELVFGQKLGGTGQQLFGPDAGFGQPSFIWRFNPAASKLGLGYVWVEDGRIVGNATLITTRTHGRFLIVNVAVHPDYRRRGIARGLMDGLIDLAQERHAKELLLQVVSDNQAAINLYQSMQFKTVGTMTSWRCSIARLKNIEPSKPNLPAILVQELPKEDWKAARQLDQAALNPDLSWPELLPEDAYKTGLWQRLVNFMNGRHTETWVTKDDARKLTGLAAIWGEWGRPHQVVLRVHPQWQGRLERPLLDKVFHRLRYLPRRNVRLDHQNDDLLVNQLLREANFQPRRTLTHMRLDIK